MISFFRTLITSLFLQGTLFSFAATLKTDKLTDLSYGLTFLIISGLTLFANPSPTFAQYLLFFLILLWSLRLAGFLFIRILKTGQDIRFDSIRGNFLKFAKFWFFQALSIPIILFPATLILSSRKEINLNIISLIGTIIWLIGFLFEIISDWQKYNFKQNPKNKNHWIENGLWKYSRHPNYFGEMTLWWGIYLYCLPHFTTWQYLSIIGPTSITLLLLKVTGIPPLENAYKKRFGKSKKYQEYKQKTSLLIPLPPRKK